MKDLEERECSWQLGEMAYLQMTRIHLLTNLYDFASDQAEVQDAAMSILISTSEIVAKFGRVNW